MVFLSTVFANLSFRMQRIAKLNPPPYLCSYIRHENGGYLQLADLLDFQKTKFLLIFTKITIPVIYR